MDMIRFFDTVRSGGAVNRWHTQPITESQDNAQHSFNAAIMADMIARNHKEADNLKVLRYMLIHDVPEIGIGDVPYPTKRENPALRAELKAAELKWCSENLAPPYKELMTQGLNDCERQICELCDQLEALFKVLEDYMKGNRLITHIVLNMYQVCYGKALELQDMEVLRMMDTISDVIDKEVS